jgi:hypothetical protein
MSIKAKRWTAAAAAGVLALTASVAAIASAPAKHSAESASGESAKHVLLISVDGLHQSDLATWVHDHPTSTLAQLSGAGTVFTSASTAKPSDSFPGLLAMVTGGSPKSTGVFYDDSYDRTLFTPAAQTPTSTQDCSGTPGAETLYAENLDQNAPSTANGGVGTRTILGPGNTSPKIDPTQLPYAKIGGKCVPVTPNDFLKTNTIFSVIKKAGMRTAWSDKHPAYQIVNGHGTPNAVDDLFAPEINADKIPATLTDTRSQQITFPFPNPSGDPNGPILTDYVGDTEAYDQIKVDAVLNQIDGLPSTGGSSHVGTPAVFGMNFQSVSVGQKVIDPTLSCERSNNGPGCDHQYVPGGYKPGTLAFTKQMSGVTDYPPAHTSVHTPGALNYVDGALGQIVSELKAKGLWNSTEIVISAKHGQSPIDPVELKKIGHAVTGVLQTDNNIAVAQNTDDDVALVWLKNQAQSSAAVTALTTAPGQGRANVENVLSGAALANTFGDPLANSRTPDLIVEPTLGTIYSHSGAKVAEHGGFAAPDTHVALLVVNGGAASQTGPDYNNDPVQTAQIAPTILEMLGLNANGLDAVKAEGTQPLPGFGDSGD